MEIDGVEFGTDGTHHADPTPAPDPQPSPTPSPSPTPGQIDISKGSQTLEITSTNKNKSVINTDPHANLALTSADGSGAALSVNKSAFSALNATNGADSIDLSSSWIGTLNAGFGFDTLLLDASSKIDFGFNAVGIKGVNSAYSGFGAVQSGQIAFLNDPATMLSLNLYGYEAGSYFIGVDGFNTQFYSVNETKGLDLIANLNGAYLIDTNGSLVSFTNMALI